MAAALALHNAGRYQDAIERYEALLKKTPDDAVVLYELAFSFSATKDYERCIAHAKRSSELATTTRAVTLALIGSCQNDAGQTAAALATFAKAIEEFPESPELNSNYAIALARKGKLEPARERLRAVIRHAPDHASSHYIYARSLEPEGALGAAIFMDLRFLMLDRETSRATEVAQAVVRLMHAQVNLETKELEVKRSGPVGAESKDLLTALNVSAATVTANALMDEQNLTAADKAVAALDIFLRIGDELRSNTQEPSYVLDRTVPQLKALIDKHVATAFLYRVAQLANLNGATAWLDRNKDDVRRMIQVLTSAAPASERRLLERL